MGLHQKNDWSAKWIRGDYKVSKKVRYPVDHFKKTFDVKNVKKAREGKTTVVIAHRVSTVERLDKILYLENGTVLAYGTHETLLATCPDYARLVEWQKLEEREAES